MIEIRETEEYAKWFINLRDLRAKSRILVRLRRLSLGNFGDVKSVGSGVSEIRIPEGKGYRVYFLRQGDTVVMLLCGGDKGSQERDIKRAHQMAQEIENGD